MHPLGWLGIAMLVLWGVLLVGYRLAGGRFQILLLLGVVVLLWAVVNEPPRGRH